MPKVRRLADRLGNGIDLGRGTGEKVTAGLLQRLKTFLSEARRPPGVRFGG